VSSIQQPAARQSLMRAISPDRLSTYQWAAARAGQDVLDLYLWDRDTAAAALADIAVLEAAMCNAMHASLATMSGRPDWYRLDIGLDDRSVKAITGAWNRLPEPQRTPAASSPNSCSASGRDLLERGGTRGAGPLRTQANYDDIWRQGLYRTFPGGRLESRASGEQWTRTWAPDVVKEVHALRNRRRPPRATRQRPAHARREPQVRHPPRPRARSAPRPWIRHPASLAGRRDSIMAPV
jgi:hypothetical protein